MVTLKCLKAELSFGLDSDLHKFCALLILPLLSPKIMYVSKTKILCTQASLAFSFKVHHYTYHRSLCFQSCIFFLFLTWCLFKFFNLLKSLDRPNEKPGTIPSHKTRIDEDHAGVPDRDCQLHYFRTFSVNDWLPNWALKILSIQNMQKSSHVLNSDLHKSNWQKNTIAENQQINPSQYS